MAVVLFGIGALLFVFLTTVVVLWHTVEQQQDRLLANHLRTKYVVTLKSGETFDGVMTDVDGLTVVLAQARSLSPARDPLMVDGSLILARADIAYMQRP